MNATNQVNKKTGCVFNVQRYSVHDGPGIRTIIFLKGCPLSCRWCSNPESQYPEPELAFNRNKCIGTSECFRCRTFCAFDAISEAADGKISIDRQKCTKCFRCVMTCPSKAMHTFGKMMSAKEVLDSIESESLFYARSGGGITISGGEPLHQIDFVEEIFKEAKRRRIDVTMETCGFADWEKLQRAAGYMKSILFDIKSMDPVKHKEYTGVSNELILQNLQRLRETFPDLQIFVRTPLIPGFNDTVEDINAILAFIKDMPNLKYELLPYHRMGQQKYEYLDRPYGMTEERLQDETVKMLQSLVSAKREIY